MVWTCKVLWCSRKGDSEALVLSRPSEVRSRCLPCQRGSRRATGNAVPLPLPHSSTLPPQRVKRDCPRHLDQRVALLVVTLLQAERPLEATGQVLQVQLVGVDI